MEEDIKALIRIYKSSAANLRKVAEIAADRNQGDSVVAHTSRAKANTYDLVISDLEDILAHRKESE
jgi:hypothetical protein